MEKPIALCLLFIAVFLSSCQFYTKREKLTAYHRISEINDSLDKMTKEWHRLLDNAVSGKNYTGLRLYRIKIGTFLSDSREDVSKLKVNANSENLIDSEEVFLGNQATIVTELYSNFDAFNDMTPDENIQNDLKLIIDDLPKEKAGSSAIRRSLDLFAIRNKLVNKKK